MPQPIPYLSKAPFAYLVRATVARMFHLQSFDIIIERAFSFYNPQHYFLTSNFTSQLKETICQKHHEQHINASSEFMEIVVFLCFYYLQEVTSIFNFS
jgi:hypothetical protein